MSGPQTREGQVASLVCDRSCLDVAVLYLNCAPVATSAAVGGVVPRACAGSCTRGVQPWCQYGTEGRTAHRAFRIHLACGVLPAEPGEIEPGPVGRRESCSRCRRRPAPLYSPRGEGTDWPVALLAEVGAVHSHHSHRKRTGPDLGGAGMAAPRRHRLGKRGRNRDKHG